MVKFFASYQPSSIAILDISTGSASSLLPLLQSEFPASTFTFKKCDISNWDEQAAVFKEIYAEFGSVNVVCANAGVSEIGNFLDADDGEPKRPILKTLDINLTGTLYCASPSAPLTTLKVYGD